MKFDRSFWKILSSVQKENNLHKNVDFIIKELENHSTIKFSAMVVGNQTTDSLTKSFSGISKSDFQKLFNEIVPIKIKNNIHVEIFNANSQSGLLISCNITKEFFMHLVLGCSKTTANNIMHDGDWKAFFEDLKLSLFSKLQVKTEPKHIHNFNEEIVDNIPVLMFMKDIHGKFLNVNKAFCDANEISKDQIIGKNILEITSNKNLAEQYDDDDERAIKKGFSRSISNEPILKESNRLFETIKMPLHNDQDEVIGIVGISNEITMLLEASETILDYNTLYKTIFETTGTATLIIESDSTISLANKEFENLSGYSKSELENKKSWKDFLEDEYLKQTTEYQKVRKEIGQEGSTNYEFKFRDKNNNYKDVFLNLAIIPGTKKCVASLLDITSIKETEEALLHQEEMMRALFNASNDMLFLFNQQGQILALNKRAVAHTKLPESIAIGQNIRQFFTSRSIVNGLDKALNIFNTKQHIQDICSQKDQWFDIRFYPIFDAKENVIQIAAFFQDITSRILAEKEKKEFEARLKQSEKMEAIGQLAGGIAHDFNNQLASIVAYNGLIKKKTKNDEALSRYTSQIEKVANRSTEMVSKLLAFGRKGLYQSIPVNMHKLIADVIPMTKHRQGQPVNILENLNAKKPMALGDPHQLQNVILNLALNARDAMTKSGTLIFESNIVKFENPNEFTGIFSNHIVPGEYLEISVSDTGTGIDPETIKHIFEPFYTTKQQGKGTGMGLAAVYGTIKSHKGMIKVESELDQGTTFRIYLPLANDIPQEEETNPPEAEVEHGLGKIMIVDDDENFRLAMSEVLKDIGYEVIICENGIAALKIFETEYDNIDLVILDMMMPQLSGRNTFFKLKEIKNDVKVIIASGYSQNDDTREVLDNGALDFLSKPFKSDELLARVATAISE